MFSIVGALRSSARASRVSSAGKLCSTIRSSPYAWRVIRMLCSMNGREARTPRREDQAPLQDVDGERQDDRAHDQRDRPAVQEPPERQDEDEEREVATEQRVRPAELEGVEVPQQRFPVDGRAQPRDE